MLKVAIVEDDRSSAEVLKRFLDRCTKENGTEFLVTVYGNGMEFLESYRPGFDIVFMDIEMPLMDGMEAAKRLREIDRRVCLIFVTNMFQLAVKGYEVDAMDFVIKPIEYFNFSLKIKKAAAYCAGLASKDVCLQLKSGFKKIKAEDIYYIESVGHNIVYHTNGGLLEVRGTMKDTEKLVEGEHFSRCGNSYLVNLKYVSELSGNTIKAGGDTIAIGRTKRKAFLSELTDYLGGLI